MEYKVNIAPGRVWAGVNIRKTNAADTHEQSGYLVHLGEGGTLGIYKNGSGELQSVSTGLTTSTINTIRVVANGSNIKVYVNGSGTEALIVTDTTYTDGYVSLVTGLSDATFDDVKITAVN